MDEYLKQHFRKLAVGLGIVASSIFINNENRLSESNVDYFSYVNARKKEEVVLPENPFRLNNIIDVAICGDKNENLDTIIYKSNVPANMALPRKPTKWNPNTKEYTRIKISLIDYPLNISRTQLIGKEDALKIEGRSYYSNKLILTIKNKNIDKFDEEDEVFLYGEMLDFENAKKIYYNVILSLNKELMTKIY